MPEAQQIQAKVSVPGKETRAPFKPALTLEIICHWIKLQGLDDYTTNGLIALARSYPTQALPSFRKNFNVMIQRVRAKRKAEQNPPKDTAEIKEKKDGQDQSNAG